MKKNALMMVLASLISFGTFAQKTTPDRGRPSMEKPTPEKMAEFRAKKMKNELGLTDAQYKKVYALHLDNAKKHEAHRKAMLSEREKYSKKMNGILTAEQAKKWEAAKKSHRAEFKGKRGVPNGKTPNKPQGTRPSRG